MPNTFTLISSSTVGAGGAASIDFTSIPSTYTDLVIKANLRKSNTSDLVKLYFNSDTTDANYNIIRLYNSSTTPLSDSYAVPYALYSCTTNDTSNTFSSSDLYIPNYANTTKNKSYSSDSVKENNGNSAGFLTAAIWNNTSAISSIQLSSPSGSFVQYSTAYLYGIVSS